MPIKFREEKVVSDDIGSHTVGSEHIAHNSIYTADNVIGSFVEPVAADPTGLAYASDKNRLWHANKTTDYIYELGTITGNVIGSFAAPNIGPIGLAFASDKNRLWNTDASVLYIYEIGTTTGNVIGSFLGPGGAIGEPYGLTFASDKNRLWCYDLTADYVYEMGTTTGNNIGSFKVGAAMDIYDLAFDSTKNRLWASDPGKGYIWDIGTTNGNIIGSIKPPCSKPHGITLSSDKKRLWDADDLVHYFFEHGTVSLYSHVKDGAIYSRHIVKDAIGSEHLEDGAVGSSIQVAMQVIRDYHISSGAVVHDAIASNAVGSLNVIDNSLGYGELTPGLQGSFDCGTVHVAGTVKVVGNIPHDSADSGGPVKIGAKAIDYRPDTAGEQGPSEVAANDRANFAANLRGELIGGVKPQYNALTNIGTTYRSTSAVTSGTVDCWQYRYANLGFELTKGSTPTDIVIEIENSLDGSHFTKQMNDYLGDWRYDDTSIGAGGIKENLVFPIACQKIRVKCKAAGVSATHRITMANPLLYLRT